MNRKLRWVFVAALVATAVALPPRAGFAQQGMQQPPKEGAAAAQQPSKEQAFQQVYGSMGQVMQQPGIVPGMAVDQPGVMASGACSLCWTCGGTWPYYGGTIPTRVGATERGASCAGNPVSSSDTIPYLCCRGW
jgi:hypothetical protein